MNFFLHPLFEIYYHSVLYYVKCICNHTFVRGRVILLEIIMRFEMWLDRWVLVFDRLTFLIMYASGICEDPW